MASSKSRLARTLRFLCDLWLGCAIAGTVGWAVWIVWLLIVPSQVANGDLIVGISGGFVGQPLAAYDSGRLFSARIESTTGVLQFRTNDHRIQMLGDMDNIIFGLVILVLAYLTRQFLVDVIDGRPFTFENARRLKWIGWLLLAFSLGKPVLHGIVARWAIPLMNIQSPELSPPSDGLNYLFVLVSIFVLILSASFRHGVELEQERSLTV